MGKFDGVLICTDLDGTLLKNDKTISSENTEAIAFFKEEGGFFTFITGRMPFYVENFYEAIKPNAPVGCINGGGLYNFEKQEYVWTKTLPREAIELVRCVDREVPGAGIHVSTFYKAYFCKDNEAMRRFRAITNLENLVCPYDAVEEPMAKIIFSTDKEEEILQVEKTLKAHPLADHYDFIRSERTLYEILPKGIGKGTSITRLVSHLGIDADKTIAIGDYNNDISMFRAAKAGIAVSNACQEALAAADYITVSNEEHAIAKVIRDLEDGRYI